MKKFTESGAIGLGAIGLVVGGMSLAGCAGHSGSSHASTGAHGLKVVQAASKERQQMMLEQVKSLAGTWEMQNPETKKWEPAVTYTVSSAGSVVREVMFPGAAHEMTNVYHMDGDSLVVTHYCAMGNQPKMRATNATNGRIDFAFDSVTNLRSGDEMYMGSMSLVWKDANTITQSWKSYKNGREETGHAPDFELRRKS
jgi:hypothetical protein